MPGTPDPTVALRSALETARRDLLDLGLRNPLLNYRTLRAKGVEVVDEDPAEVFKILVQDEKRMTFLPSDPMPPLANGAPSLGQPELDPNRHTDLRLQTEYPSTQLQSRLLSTYYAARTSMEEQGVNTLYLALGMLRWTEREDTQKVYRAPLILLPVELERSDARDRFHLKYTGEELGSNISLAEKLKMEFGYQKFPELPDSDELEVSKYLEQVQRLIKRESGWTVEAEAIALGFFSFAKFLMYRDLDPGTWADAKGLLGHDVLGRLLGSSGFERGESKYGDEDLLDEQLRGRPPVQVVDADSTQTVAILDAMDGRSMVVQGPPGTGKSQTIVNLIAAAVAAGKRVLFVSEKMAALDVVKRRLDRIGLGGPCLELHSNRSNKKTVLDELKRTVFRTAPSGSAGSGALDRLATLRDRLNAYCTAVNAPIGNSGETPSSAYGKMLEAGRALRDVEDLPALALDGANWSAADVMSFRDLVGKLEQRVARCGIPVRHPYWGCRLMVLLPTDADEIVRRTKTSVQSLGELEAAGRALGAMCNSAAPANVAEAELMADTAAFAATAPDVRNVDPSSPVWFAHETELSRVIQAGTANAKIRRQYSGVLRPEAWDRDVAELRREVDHVGSKWWRFLSGRWKELRQQVAGLCVGDAPRDRSGMLHLLDGIIEAGTSTALIETADVWMGALYGAIWRKASSDWELLERQASWILEAQRRVGVGALSPWCLDAAVLAIDRPRLAKVAGELRELIAKFETAVKEWVKALQFEFPKELEPRRMQSWAVLRERWVGQLAASDQIQALVAYNQIATECQKAGLSHVADLATSWPLAGSHLVALFERSRLASVLGRAFQERPALATFDGGDHTKVVDDFRRLDVLELEYTRTQIATRHVQGLPRGGGNGEIGVIWREFEKKRKHIPIRKLIEGAGHAIQSIKPVFMMSPLSIANYLPPGCLEFDLVIFDEASQVKPVDALGAVVRGEQIVVVGDSKQLPPTSFFDSLTNADESEDEESAPTADIESILGLFSARGAHQRMLQWHYRSRHHSLITPSNHLFYDDRLVVFPSPSRERESIGLVYRRMEGAWYDRSRTRTNPLEAKAVATAVMEHARVQLQFPREQRETLGVAAFSVAQMDAILDEVELLRRQDPACEEFFGYPPHEPFFVKNLENVQGDERDVILISIGYGRTKEGFLAMNFGPLNRPGGERRLNVLISRARRRCEVFTSLAADDIDTTKSPAGGVAALKAFLHYAQTGIIETSAATDREPDSDFEVQVKREVESLGYTVHSQVGCAGFFIDLALVDAANSGRYVIGIECDGASYHSARSARDRDRLRQAVLEGLGWRMHRIWSTDWFQNPDAELRRLVQAIQVAQDSPAAQPPTVRPAASAQQDPLLPVGAEVPDDANLTRLSVAAVPDSVPYVCATVDLRLGSVQMHEVSPVRLAGLMGCVVKVESPVHWREAARRVIAAAGVQRMGARIENAFVEALRYGPGEFIRRGEFLWKPGMDKPPVRDRSSLPSAARKLELVAPEEIRRAIVDAVTASYGMAPDEVPNAVCRIFGFARVTEEMKAEVQPHVQALLQFGELKLNGQNLVASQAASA
jgi:very-short-patch-repair endonuclease